MTETRERVRPKAGSGENLCHIPDMETIIGPYHKWVLSGRPGGSFEFKALCGVWSQTGNCYGKCDVCQICNDLSPVKHP